MLLAAEAADGGWAHLVGLVIAVLIAVLAVSTHQWRMGLRDPSPTPPGDDEYDVTPGETYDPDPDDTDDDTTDHHTWSGRRIRLADGSIVVRRHVLDVVDEDDEPGEDEAETREEMADRLIQEGGSYADWVREIMGAHDVSEATAKRAIRDARERIDV